MKVSEMEARGSKTLVGGDPVKQPSWLVWCLMKAYRIVLLTLLWAGLGMGFGLFCGIAFLLVQSLVAHTSPDMSLAYRNVSIPAAIGTGSCAFVWNLGQAFKAARARRRELKQGKMA